MRASEPLRRVRAFSVVAVVIVALAASCSITTAVGLDNAAIAESASTPTAAPEPELRQTISVDEAVEPVPEPTAPEPTAPEPAAPEPEPTEAPPAQVTEQSVFDGESGRAPVFATGTGGGCLDADGIWANGFRFVVFLRDKSDLVSVVTEVTAAPIVLAISTLPQDLAWSTLQAELATSDAINSLSIDDLHSGFALDFWSLEGARDGELESLVATLRSNRSVLVITDNRCTNNVIAQVIDG